MDRVVIITARFDESRVLGSASEDGSNEHGPAGLNIAGTSVSNSMIATVYCSLNDTATDHEV